MEYTANKSNNLNQATRVITVDIPELTSSTQTPASHIKSSLHPKKMASAPSTFHHFPDLPAELRISIWHHALQEHDKPALYTYKEGCWTPRSKPPHIPIKLHFQHEKLTPVEVKIPIAHVNQEARDIATSWGLKQGIERHYIPHKECYVFARVFDPDRDVLYMSAEQMSKYNNEIDTWFGGEYGDGFVLENISWDVCRLALPAETVDTDGWNRYGQGEWFMLPREGLETFDHLEEVYFVLGPQPEYLGPGIEIAEPRWSLEEVESRGLGWDGSTERFLIGEDEQPARREFYERVAAACKWVNSELTWACEYAPLEARPVFVVRS